MPNVPPELHPGTSIVFVGRDPGAMEAAAEAPFVGQAGTVLMTAIAAAGHQRTDASYALVVGTRAPKGEWSQHRPADVAVGAERLQALLRELKPNVVVACGNEAAFACVPEWPSRYGKGIMQATDIEKRRGYLWEGHHGGKVLTTLNPSAVIRDASGISEMLFTHDVEKAFQEAKSPEMRRPIRVVDVVDTHAKAREAAAAILAAGRAACDIEITAGPDHRCACVGFATSPLHAYVFTPDTMEYAYALLTNDALRLVWQNGQFDMHFLLTRCGIRTHVDEDTIIMWHTLWPEMAGQAQDAAAGYARRGAKRTHKGLAFLASLYTRDAWWKDYDFRTDMEKYILNGRDCCITLEIADALTEELAAKALEGVHAATVARVPIVVDMQARGLLVDEGARVQAFSALDARHEAAVVELMELALEPLEAARDRLSKPQLIWHRKTCPCCRNGAGKREECWECAGFERKPTKADTLEYAKAQIRKLPTPPAQKARHLEALKALKADELRALYIKPCSRCGGQGAWEEYSFNPGSTDQMHMLLFEALRLPPRASVDEASLKSLLGVLS